LDNIFKMKLTPSDIKWGFLTLPTKIVNKLPEMIHISYKEQNHHFAINSAQRIVSKKFFGSLNLKSGDFIVLTGNDNTYALSIEKSQ
jgi:hypothetical protein